MPDTKSVTVDVVVVKRRLILIDADAVFCRFFNDVMAAQTRSVDDVLDFFTAELLSMVESRARVNEYGLSTFLLMASALDVKSENSLTLCCRLKT